MYTFIGEPLISAYPHPVWRILKNKYPLLEQSYYNTTKTICL